MTSRNLTRVVASGALLLAACSDSPAGPKPNPGPVPVAVVQVSPGTTELAIGETKQLGAVTRDSAGNVLNNRPVAWTSSDTAVAKVSAAGLVTAVASGAATITARSENREGRAEVTVAAARVPVSAVRIVAVVADTIEAWDQVQLTALALDSAGAPLAGREITWSSSNPAVASVNAATGLLTGLDRGTVTITATSEGRTDAMTRVVVIRYRSLVTGSSHACNLASGGIAWCWGLNGRDGRIGGADMSDNAFSTEPQRVPGDHRFVQLATYSRTTCGLTAQGQAWCWGTNAWGALGIGAGTPQQSNVPMQVTGGHNFRSIAAGSSHMCGITTAGRIWCWGYNNSGELGNGSRTYSPQPVAGQTALTVESLALGADYSCAITTNGQTWCWGFDGRGNLGDGRPASNGNTFSLTPVQVTGGHVFRQITAGQYTTCGVTTANQAFCWGRNGNRFGSGNTTDSSSPVAVAGGHSFRQLSAGFGHACAVTADHAVYCWGSNDNGQLGAAGLVNGSATPVRAGGSLRAAEVSAANINTGSGNISCAISQDRLTTLCWGRNDLGQLGNGATTAPIAVNHQPSIVVGQRPL